MSKFWRNINRILPITTFYLFSALTVEASIISKPQEISPNWQDKINFKNPDRQEYLISNFTIKPDKNKTLVTQTNRIEQLQDIKPTDWSYQALKNLIERYDCIKGFPKQTAQGET